ncbi:ubiquitin-related domain-containing protein [Hygrophoropsis aurantiaca]|uniref:Ubiquitin-related domain-containing protein n=1 Tax=Hygrophoropsis aurantiaca TaxID=72124 RepID=A0ACB7ZTS4_9AGAM|nr:ubiquitin-related domain-containing protein [Hygrophoropsis aurantiaca]
MSAPAARDDTEQDKEPEIQINVKGPSELKLQISIRTSNSVAELKDAIAAAADVPAERQRLIYSGRVLKDEDPLSAYKIQAGHTVHMVKRSDAAPPTPSHAPPALPTMQAGQNPSDPLTMLNSHLGFGALPAVGGAMADMGVNMGDPNMMQNLLSSPAFLQQMSGVLSNPDVLNQLMQANPQLQAMAPQMREIFQSERFREMM